MLWFITLAGVAVLAVTAYRQLQHSDAAAAERFIESLRQITALTVVVGQSVIAAVDALGHSPAGYAYPASSSRRVYGSWGEFDD